jgi:putative ABC transport system substrate-binding protein
LGRHDAHITMIATRGRILTPPIISAVCAVAAFFLALGFAAEAQQAKQIPRIGFLGSSSAERDQSRLAAFQQGLRELGYRDGRDITIEQRYAAGAFAKLAELAAELVSLKTDVIVTEGTPAARAAKQATSSVPIVMGNAGDPVGTGLVASLGRPGGNITGLSDFSLDLMTKRFGLLREVIPSASRVGMLLNPGNPTNNLELKAVQAAARTVGMTVVPLEVRGGADLERAYGAIGEAKAAALIVAGDPLLGTHSERILELAMKSRLPGVYPGAGWAASGGLIGFATNFDDLFRRAAAYVDKILRGAKPADLPIEQPTKFELAINLRTAKALGVTIPPSLLLQADQVIE